MGGRSHRACEIMEAEGYSRLVTMYGGFNGARDRSGTLLEKGWQECGFPAETGPSSERGYEKLKG